MGPQTSTTLDREHTGGRNHGDPRERESRGVPEQNGSISHSPVPSCGGGPRGGILGRSRPSPGSPHGPCRTPRGPGAAPPPSGSGSSLSRESDSGTPPSSEVSGQGRVPGFPPLPAPPVAGKP